MATALIKYREDETGVAPETERVSFAEFRFTAGWLELLNDDGDVFRRIGASTVSSVGEIVI